MLETAEGGEKQAYLLQGGKEWRKKVKKEKKNQELYYQVKGKVETEIKEWFLFRNTAFWDMLIECVDKCVRHSRAIVIIGFRCDLLSLLWGFWKEGGKNGSWYEAHIVPYWPRRLHPTWWAVRLLWSPWFRRSSFQKWTFCSSLPPRRRHLGCSWSQQKSLLLRTIIWVLMSSCINRAYMKITLFCSPNPLCSPAIAIFVCLLFDTVLVPLLHHLQPECRL